MKMCLIAGHLDSSINIECSVDTLLILWNFIWLCNTVIGDFDKAFITSRLVKLQ